MITKPKIVRKNSDLLEMMALQDTETFILAKIKKGYNNYDAYQKYKNDIFMKIKETIENTISPEQTRYNNVINLSTGEVGVFGGTIKVIPIDSELFVYTKNNRKLKDKK